MMDSFRTNITAPKFPFHISHGDQVVMLGSCFTENIGGLMQSQKFDVTVNPFGILFNPFSIMNALERMLNDRPYTESELLKVNEHWVSLDHHGSFNKKSPKETLDEINQNLAKGRDGIKSANYIFITLGSAWVYNHKVRNHIVANCHKIPNTEFEKQLLSFQDVHLILRHIPEFLAAKKINAQVVFTVSPVRHWKDGAIENQRSKSILNSAIHEVVDEFESCHYFPSYEFMMDDLRDYRFYGQDMLHPTPQAIHYIWEKFMESFFTEETASLCKEVKAIVEAGNHRPIDPESNSFQRFLRKQVELIDELEAKHPALNFKVERERFEAWVL